MRMRRRLSPKKGELLPRHNDPLLRGGEGPVIEGRLPAPRPERYDSVADYDPVLRAHCRLDKPG